jgi:hypothetical protein
MIKYHIMSNIVNIIILIIAATMIIMWLTQSNTSKICPSTEKIPNVTVLTKQNTHFYYDDSFSSVRDHYVRTVEPHVLSLPSGSKISLENICYYLVDRDYSATLIPKPDLTKRITSILPKDTLVQTRNNPVSVLGADLNVRLEPDIWITIMPESILKECENPDTTIIVTDKKTARMIVTFENTFQQIMYYARF